MSEQIDPRVAELLTGDLSDEERAGLRAAIQAEPQLEHQYLSLQATAEAIRGLAPDPSMAAVAAGTAIARPYRRWPALLRTAAVVLLAFGAGYLVRDRLTAPPAAATPDSREVALAPAPAPATTPETDVREAFARRYRQVSASYPQAGSFGRSVLALAGR